MVAILATSMLALSGCSPTLPSGVASASPNPRGSLPANAASFYNKAEGLHAAGQCARAVPLYLHAIMANPMYVNAYDRLGLCYGSMGAYAAGIVELDKAIQIDPKQFGLYLDRAGLEAINGSTGAATADNLTAMQLVTPQVPSYLSIATNFASYGDFPDAVRAYDKAIALVPGNPSLYEQRAGIYMKMQDSGHAFADYQRAIRVAPFIGSRASVYADLAGVYDQMQDYDSALRAINTAIRLQPNNPGLYVTSGQIHKDSGDLSAAINQYGRALRLGLSGPNALSAHETRGDLFGQIGRPKQAIAEYRQALHMTASNDIYTRPRLTSKIKALQPGHS